ncbi:hypothetical protein [Streptomyces sp. 8L]|uniref:hypothetical protein n=1 Tax=Streptomyces sp. 8L TaxID=2877242 RepID=UPI001CD6A987|nr:hypothetical protein [Streptomyces sp. 8L]MCA1218485.1 hypothetical protein [Streptomyces sp. 8L]
MDWKKWTGRCTPRGMVLLILGAFTLGVASMSVRASYQVLDPHFGLWAAPTVAALDALWIVFQATEILAGNNSSRVRPVRWAGLALTLVNAAIPTTELLQHADKAAGFDMAYVLTPVAIVLTKLAWKLVLPSLGRKVSDKTRESIDERRQKVADRLEVMEADAAHRIELLQAATHLERRVARAETAYRRSTLKTRQRTTEALHKQAQATEKTIQGKPLPAAVAAITLPDLDTWEPGTRALDAFGTLALPAGSGPEDSGTVTGTATSDRHGDGTQVNTGAAGEAAQGGTPAHPQTPPVTLTELAAVAGVPVPETGEQLTDEQLDVVLRHLRYREDPPRSYRQARDEFREAGFVGSEERIRRSFGVLMSKEETTPADVGRSASAARSAEDDGTADDDSEDARA